MVEEVRRERSPGMKLLFAAIVGAVLAIPLLIVYSLVWDRQSQSNTAQTAITQGWGGAQVVAGPVVAIPYKTTQVTTSDEGGRRIERGTVIERWLYVAPQAASITTEIAPERRRKSIYETVLYTARTQGTARFALPGDLPRYGIAPGTLELARAELRFGISDARGLQTGGTVTAGGQALPLQPGKGLAATGNAGFFSFLSWDGAAPLDVQFAYGLRGSRAFSLVPRGRSTQWTVKSAWPHPSFAGSFLPTRKQVGDSGFSAEFGISDLALGQAPVSRADPGPPMLDRNGVMPMVETAPPMRDTTSTTEEYAGPSAAASVQLVEPVDLYSRVDRSVKYGFLFIGFTFLAYLMFDIVGGARVAAAEYLLTGAGLVLFFILLLALAEVIGFTPAYLVASAAIIGLLTAYSAAVLKSWRRAGYMGALLVALYALLFVLLSLEAWSLLIGAVLLFAALAGVMYATRRIDWSAVGRRGEIAP